MLSRIAVLAVIAFSSIVTLRSASAQIVYEPVQYRYGSGHNLFFYGGSDPNVIRRGFWESGGWQLPYGEPVSLEDRLALANSDAGQGFFPPNTGLFVRDNWDGGLPVRVFSDALSRRNARLHGFTPSDAQNEANNNVPRFFVKGEEFKTAYVDNSGAIIVPAIPIRDEDTQHVRFAGRELVGRGGIVIRPWDSENRIERPATSTSPTTMPTARASDPSSTRKPAIIIIPKNLLDRPLSSFKKNQVASAAN